MVIIGNDNRVVVNPNIPSDFNKFPLPAVAAIDTFTNLSVEKGADDTGSGIVISPNYVLTAGHNVLFTKRRPFVNKSEVRVTTSANQLKLNDREIGFDNGRPGDATEALISDKEINCQ